MGTIPSSERHSTARQVLARRREGFRTQPYYSGQFTEASKLREETTEVLVGMLSQQEQSRRLLRET